MKTHYALPTHQDDQNKKTAYINARLLDPESKLDTKGSLLTIGNKIADFGPHSVLLDFSKGIEDPAIRYLGRALREECGVGADIGRIADVPSRSLLSPESGCGERPPAITTTSGAAALARG